MSQTDANVQQVIEQESQKVLYMECYGNPFFFAMKTVVLTGSFVGFFSQLVGETFIIRRV